MAHPPEVTSCDISPLEAAYAYTEPRTSLRRSRSDTASTLSDETDPLWHPVWPRSDGSKNIEQRQDAEHRPRSHRGSWFARVWTAIVVLTTLYSTVMSGIWFVLAVTSYEYDIGKKSPANTSTLITAIAKTIELSFELASVAVVGQELTRRLTKRSCNGINLAQMQLKSFLAQPGSMIANWQALFHVAPTLLGITCILIGIIPILYTTASDSLVAPNLISKSKGVQTIPATVQTSFMNATFIQSSCPSQVTLDQDPDALSACDGVRQIGFVYHDLMSYLDNFEESAMKAAREKQNLTLVRHRPNPVAMLASGTGVNGQWLQSPSSASQPIVSQQDGRTVNNATILLPHAGVEAAANNLAQGTQNGAGGLQLSASVATPAINVQCASFDADDPTLSAIVVSEWSAAQNASVTPNLTYVLNTTEQFVRSGWYNGSEFDVLWRFTPSHRPPAFPNLPGVNNTRISWSANTNGTAYLLGRAPDSELFMCALTTTMVRGCSTEYRAGEMSLNCKADNHMAYASTHADAPAQLGFGPVANAWSLSLGLGAPTDSDTSIARVLTQLWPSSGVWNSSKPSLAETLAVLAGSVALSGAVGAPLGDIDENGQSLGEASSALPVSATATATTVISHQPTVTASALVLNSAFLTAITKQAAILPTEATGALATTISRAAAARVDVELQHRAAAATSTPVAGPPQVQTFQAAVTFTVYAAGGQNKSQLPFFIVLMGAWFFNCLFLLYIVGTLIARRRSSEEDLGADAEGAGTWTLRADLADPQALFGLALNSRPDERLADASLAPLPRKAMSQRWRVAGGKNSVYIHPIGRRRSTLRRAVSAALVSTVGSLSRKNSGLQKEQITRIKEVV